MTFDSLYSWKDLESQYLNIKDTPILSLYLLIEWRLTIICFCLVLPNEDHDFQIIKDMDLCQRTQCKVGENSLEYYSNLKKHCC